MPGVVPSTSNVLLQMAEELAYTCYMTFARQPTHLAPEITHFNYEESSSREAALATTFTLSPPTRTTC